MTFMSIVIDVPEIRAQFAFHIRYFSLRSIYNEGFDNVKAGSITVFCIFMY